MRIATLILIGMQAAVVAVVIFNAATVRSDAAGEGMAFAYAFIAMAAFVLFALPALIVALATSLQGLALSLSILGVCGFLVLMGMF